MLIQHDLLSLFGMALISHHAQGDGSSYSYIRGVSYQPEGT